MLVIAGQATSWLELAAFGTGLLSVWLTARMHIANWPVGIVNVACFAVLFTQARLYASAALQVAFLVLAVYGWWNWTRLKARGMQVVPATRAPARELLVGGAVAAAGSAACAAFLSLETDSAAPWADSAVLAFSLLATWLQARGRIEHWWLWIAIDVVSIPLYGQRGLPLTALLYGIFLVLCVVGLRDWTRRAVAVPARA